MFMCHTPVTLIKSTYLLTYLLTIEKPLTLTGLKELNIKCAACRFSTWFVGGGPVQWRGLCSWLQWKIRETWNIARFQGRMHTSAAMPRRIFLRTTFLGGVKCIWECRFWARFFRTTFAGWWVGARPRWKCEEARGEKDDGFLPRTLPSSQGWIGLDRSS